MTRFTTHFKMDTDQAGVDFVDIDTATDTPVFIDPFAISIREDEFSLSCADQINSFYETAIGYIKDEENRKAQLILNNLSEPNETFLGLSQGKAQGKGVSGKQANDLYEKLARSDAAKSGMISDLAECDLFIPGIGPDKISDITTNILRGVFLQYTKDQCDLHDIPLRNVAAGRIWNIRSQRWESVYAPMPVINGQKVLLVPKHLVRMQMSLNSQEFYNHHILNFLQRENLQKRTGLVHKYKNGRETVFKKKLKENHPFNKEWLAKFSEKNPAVLEAYKEMLKKLPGAKGVVRNSDLDDEVDERALAAALTKTLANLPKGDTNAAKFHSLSTGIMELIFWPHIGYPRPESPIHNGRKKIDIVFANLAKDGFFWRAHKIHGVPSATIMVECKNYTKDPKNPEVDQLNGRFDVNRGKLGFLIYRDCSNYNMLLQRCQGLVKSQNNHIIPIGDGQITAMLNFVAIGKRHQIDEYLTDLHFKIIS